MKYVIIHFMSTSEPLFDRSEKSTKFALMIQSVDRSLSFGIVIAYGIPREVRATYMSVFRFNDRQRSIYLVGDFTRSAHPLVCTIYLMFEM